MRVVACNIHSPLLCLCKCNASDSICSHHQVPACSISSTDENIQPKEEKKEGGKEEKRRSCIASQAASGEKDNDNKKKHKKKVQWMDLVGKPLFEIREFELTRETEEREWNVEMNTRSCCACVIL